MSSARRDSPSSAEGERSTGEGGISYRGSVLVSSSSDCSETDLSPVASIVGDDDYETHAGCEEDTAEDEDLSVYLLDESVADQTARLVREGPCEAKCLNGKEGDLGNFLTSLSTMEKAERVTSLMTALAVLKETDTRKYHRGKELRIKFHYFLPLIATTFAIGATADATVEFGRHTEATRRTSVSETPSIWYFLSLLSVSVFGIYYANDSKQHNFIYDERVSGKGTDQVNSMLDDFLKTQCMLIIVVDKHVELRDTLLSGTCSPRDFDKVDFKFLCEATPKMRVTEV
ncbi:Hypothetical protein PHPALM_3367 [Phytophthora palmivora]|uniref:Uncharacterized protein n=1 Tax=Phytophthora palmivora TaxID=4796 RepID=A0A2P4YMK2_9STRA|nr:Hypothetical protein PHPALM_3367 [Phytophthora palmivora]